MKVFERSGPVNTHAVIDTLKAAPNPPETIIVASVTVDSAVVR